MKRRRALCLTAVLTAACAPVAMPPPDATDLLAPGYAPVLLRETTELRPPSPELLSGFYGREPGAAEAGVWAGPGPLRIALDFTQPRPRRLEIEARAFAWPGAPALPVAAYLDGIALGGFELAGRWSNEELAVPSELSVAGRHLLELRPAWARAPREVRPASNDRRRLSLRFASLRVLPLTGAAEAAPEIASGKLVLPPATRASWALWIPPGARLRSEIRARGGAGDEPRVVVEKDGQPAKALAGAGRDRPELPSGAVRLSLAGPRETGRFVVHELAIETAAGERPGPAAPVRTAASDAVLIVGTLRDGFPITPCTSDRRRALRCLLSGQEAAAFGYEAPLAVDFVGHTVDEVVAFLGRVRNDSAGPHAVAALVAPGQPALRNAAALRERVPGIATLLTSLPSGPKNPRLMAQVQVPAVLAQPINASHLDLVATAYALAGRPARARGSGVDLLPSLRAAGSLEVRPAAALWDGGRSLAVAGDHTLELVPGEPFYPRSVLDEVLVGFLERRRRAVAWLAP